MPPSESNESRVRRAARDPVVRFLVIGAALFAAHEWRRVARDVGDPIVVSSGFVEGLREEHRQRFGRVPSPGELERAVTDYVREEALVREATALGLDRGDSIIRRRLAQKMEMQLRGGLEIARPDDAAIRAYVDAHPEDFARDARFSLRHAFFARDRRGDAARAEAETALAALAATASAAPSGTDAGPADPGERLRGLGDAFPLGQELVRKSGADVERQFGARFRAGLETCALARPCGPIESTYGFHVVVVSAREPAGTLPFAEARALAERALLRDLEEAALERAISEVIARHPVERTRDRGAR